jgi:hypothetical protein
MHRPQTEHWQIQARVAIGFVVVIALLALAPMARAQQRMDPNLQLLLSQPPVDLETPVTATAVMDPPVLVVGELGVLRVTLNALEASVRWPSAFPEIPDLQITSSSGGQILPLAAGVQRPVTARNFHVRGERQGFFTIPAFEVLAYGKRVMVPSVSFEVARTRRAGTDVARQLVLQLSSTNAYVGQPLTVTVLCPGTISNLVSGLAQLNFTGEGILGAKTPMRQLVEPREFDGRRIATVVYESTITPLAAGDLKVAANGFSAGMFFTGPVTMQGNISFQGFAAENVLLDSEPAALRVQPLPPIAAEAGFTGFIGEAEADAPVLSSNALRVGDALRFTVTFRHAVRNGRFVPPPAPRSREWQIFSPTPVEGASPAKPGEYALAFAYTMIPVSEEVSATPVIPFHVFDPDVGVYKDLTLLAVPVKVSAEGLPTNWVAEMAALMNEGSRPERARLPELQRVPGAGVVAMRPVQLSAGFFAVQSVPVLCLLGAWGLERRRRFLLAHPDIVRRRIARRALRRERKMLRRCARLNDEPSFVTHVAAAMRVAAAPHLPAVDRAVVCEDVLSVVESAAHRNGRSKLVREIFEAENAACFSKEATRCSHLLEARNEIEALLNEMEAGL